MVLVPNGVSVLFGAREASMPWCTVMAPLMVLAPENRAKTPTLYLSSVPVPETGPNNMMALMPVEAVVVVKAAF